MTEGQTDGQRDRRTDRGTGRELTAWRTDKGLCSLSLLTNLLRPCFYHAERILFAIAKFLVHLFGEGEGWAEIGEGRGRRRKWWGRRRAENGNARKNSHKTQHIWHLGKPTKHRAVSLRQLSCLFARVYSRSNS